MLKTNRKLGLLLVLLLSVCLIFVACSGGNSEGSAGPTGPADGSDTNEGQGNMDGSDGSLDIDIGDQDSDKSAKLPATYPSDVFPVYKDSFIMSVIEMDGGFVVTAFSKADYKEVIAFYKEVLKDAEVTAETNLAESYTSFGKIDKYSYNFDTGASDEMEGYKSAIVILLMDDQ